MLIIPHHYEVIKRNCVENNQDINDSFLSIIDTSGKSLFICKNTGWDERPFYICIGDSVNIEDDAKAIIENEGEIDWSNINVLGSYKTLERTFEVLEILFENVTVGATLFKMPSE